MRQEDRLVFKRIERGFWLLWAIAPILVLLLVHYMWNSAYAPSIDGKVGTIPVSKFSFNGQLLVAIDFFINAGICITLVVWMHRLVRCFARGEMLISATLRTINYIAWLMLLYSLMPFPLYNLNLYLLYSWGDLPAWHPVYFIDVMSLAFALTLFALRTLINHAIRLQEDVDLTV
jgi:hypothetical protein